MVAPSMQGRSQARRWRVSLLALALAMAVTAVACGSTKSPSDGGASASPVGEGPPVNGGAISVGVPVETVGWNTHYSEAGQTGTFVISSVLEPLAEIGEDSSAKPWLATQWYPNETFDKWQVTLRDDVTFQNGEKFDAEAVKKNTEDAMTAPLSGQAISGLFKSVSVVDEHNVLFEMTQPWAAFPSSYLSGGTFMMAPASLASADHGNSHPVGTGPFTFDSWTPGDSFKVKKNPTYWQQGLPHLDEVTFKVVTDNASRALGLRSGDLNMMLTTAAEDANNLDGDYTVIRDWDTEASSLITNTIPAIGDKPNPLANAHARKALAYATDRGAIAENVGAGVISTSSPFAPSNPWGMPEDQNNYPNYDVDRAKAEVAAYEQETGASSLTFTLSSIADVDTNKVVQLVQSQWRDAGIDVELESLESTSFLTKVVKGDYELAFFQIYSAPDPDQSHYFWSADTIHGYGGVNINFYQYTTPEIEHDLDIGRENGYPDQRKVAYDDLVKRRNEAAVDIWMYFTPWTIVADKSVRGLAKPEKIAFANYEPKTWWGDVWHE